VRWYLRFNASYRDVEELLVERGVEVDHVTVYRWVQRFTPLLADAARFTRHAPGDRWFVDETYAKVNGGWRYVYRAIDQYGQVIDVLVCARRDAATARRFFLPKAWHHVERHAHNPIEADHSQLEHRAQIDARATDGSDCTGDHRGHGFIQNVRRGHYQLAVDVCGHERLAATFAELARAI
jgi:transposase-like protein